MFLVITFLIAIVLLPNKILCNDAENEGLRTVHRHRSEEPFLNATTVNITGKDSSNITEENEELFEDEHFMLKITRISIVRIFLGIFYNP
uniref:Uncharacterized protein n=1 Tax=Isometrus maculatus TaxID=497827 RepID=A0A0U1SST8_ISOMC|nr:hypothetical protein [Isometrus maculatus]